MAAAKRIAPRLDGKRLESVEALGKNLLLRFEGGLTLQETTDDELRTALDSAARLMHESAHGARTRKHVHHRAGRSCPRCGGTIRSLPLGDAARTAYWCPICQREVLP